jgi:hypothetical protein
MLKTEVILKLWLVEVPEYTPLFCRLVLLQALVSATQRPYVMAIHATGKMKIPNLSGGIILLLVLPISYYFLRMNFAAYIPFVIYLLAFIVTSSIEIFLLYRWIKLPVYNLIRKVYFPIVAIIISSLPISLVINKNSTDSFVSLIYVTAISVLLVAVSTYYVALNSDMRSKILKIVLTRK